MTPVISLREPIVLPPAKPDPDESDPEAAFQGARSAGWDDDAAAALAAHTAHLPIAAGDDGTPLGWSIRNVRHLRFLRRLVADGRLGGDTEVDR